MRGGRNLTVAGLAQDSLHQPPHLNFNFHNLANGELQTAATALHCIQLPCCVWVDIDGEDYAEKNLVKDYFVLRNFAGLFCGLRAGGRRSRHAARCAGSSATSRSPGTLLEAGWN
jgi:hypothetical protein